MLTVTGCIPKYLEEIIPTDSVEQNIERLCFTKTGYLFLDFDRIFNDVFHRRAAIYANILRRIIDDKLDATSVAEKLGITQGGDLTAYLDDMCATGFIARDYTWNFKGKRGRLNRYRIRDNYLRFYLKYILLKKSNRQRSLSPWVY